jgi:sugar O-acyltransferase (sialic acid O-acetyltransferase NeuD family)
MERIGIFGTSGMAREIGDLAVLSGYSPIYIARNQVELDAWNYSAEAMLESCVEQYMHMPYVVGIGENIARQRLVQRFDGKIQFANLIHPSATFGLGQKQTIEACQGVIVCAGVRFTNCIKVGNFCIFNQNATIAHDVIIEEYVHLAPGSIISGNVHIGARCWVGAGAVINQGGRDSKLTVGMDTVIGSGSVVISACDANAIYAGVPARRIK